MEEDAGIFAPVLRWQRPPQSWGVSIVRAPIETDRGPARWRHTGGGVVLDLLPEGWTRYDCPPEPFILVEGERGSVGILPPDVAAYEPMSATGRNGLLPALALMPTRGQRLERAAVAVLRHWGPLRHPLTSGASALTWADDERVVSLAPGSTVRLPLEARSPAGRTLYGEPLALWASVAAGVQRILAAIVETRSAIRRSPRDDKARSAWAKIHNEISTQLARLGVTPVVEPGRDVHDACVRLRPQSLLGAVWSLLALELVAADAPLSLARSTMYCQRCGELLPDRRRSTRRFCPGCAKRNWEEHHREKRTAERRKRRQHARQEACAG